jgi:hypothetical protein
VLAALALWLLCCTSALAATFEEGVAAYDQGRYDTALAAWLPLAEAGHPAAQYNVGVMFEKGQGVSQDWASAARWYLEAAEGGDIDAQLKVATLYESGIGLAADAREAELWYRRVMANPRAERSAFETKRVAREKLAQLSPAVAAQGEVVAAYPGGRFLLRHSVTKECVVALQGVINASSREKFDEILGKASGAGCSRPMTLLLESPGGELTSGISLAYAVLQEKLQTVTRYDCASACALIFLSGDERILWGSRARIGFHEAARVSDKLPKRCEQTMDSPAVVRMRRYLHLRFDSTADADRIFQLIMDTSCNSIEWVAGQRALELHVATRLEEAKVDVFGPKNLR